MALDISGHAAKSMSSYLDDASLTSSMLSSGKSVVKEAIPTSKKELPVEQPATGSAVDTGLALISSLL